MKLWGAISAAIAGWMMILRGDAQWRDQFSLNAPGLVTALVIFFCCAFIAIAVASLASTMPDIFGVMDLLLVHGIWILSLLAAIQITARTVSGPSETLALLVPGIYLLVGYLLAGTVLNLFLPPLLALFTLALLYPLYRLARAASTWNRGVSGAFAAATVLLLVAVPQALYMLSNAAL